MSQNWLTILIIVLIVAIVADGIRRMRTAKKDSIKMSLRKHFDDDNDEDDNDVIYGSEFPNGGARSSGAEIDKERILEARSRYNFGDDLPTWNKNETEDGSPKEDAQDDTVSTASEAKIEPSLSFDAADDIEDPSASLEDIEEPKQTASASAQKTRSVPELDKPVQTSLNLDDDVPLLMEEIETAEEALTTDASHGDGSLSTAEVIEELEKPIQSVAAKIAPSAPEIDTHSANKPRFESKYTEHADKRGQMPQDVIVVNLRARNGELNGSDLLPVILDNGLRFGAMDIFHYHAEDEGEGDVLFSMANIVKPGTFNLPDFEHFNTVGLSFFLTLPVTVGSHMQAFEQMIDVTQAMAKALDAELLDENRSILTRQATEHYRERVRDFSRREQLEKNK